MSGPIEPGCLAMVVRPMRCCGSLRGMYRVFTVGQILHDEIGRCEDCDEVRRYQNAATVGDSEIGYALYQLKRIDPLPPEETIFNQEEQTA